MAAAFAAAVAVVSAFDIALAAAGGVAAVARVTLAYRVEAAPFDARVHGADDVVAAVGCAATRAASRAAIPPRAALLAVAATRRLAAFAGRAHADGARVVVGVAFLIGAALLGAAQVWAAACGVVAEGVHAQACLAAVCGAAAAVVTSGGVAGFAGFLAHAAVGQRAVAARAAAGQAGLVLARAGKADVVGAGGAVVAVRVFAALTAITLAALLIPGAFGGRDARAVSSADILGARISIAAIFGAAAVHGRAAARAGRAARAGAGLVGAALTEGRAAGGASHRPVAELGAAAARGRSYQSDPERREQPQALR